MATTTGKSRLSVQAKVLFVVLGFLVLLPVFTVWIVDDRLGLQMEDEARQTLETAEAVFSKLLNARADNFLSRYRGYTAEARFKVTAGIADPKTMTRLLHDLAADSPGEHEVFLFSTRQEGVIAGEHRESAPATKAFAQAAEGITRAALAGTQAAGSVGLDGKVYNVVAVPVDNDRGEPAGALTVGVRLGAEAFRELRLPRTEVLLLIGGKIAASSFESSEKGESVLRRLAAADVASAGARRVFSVEAGGEHFLALAGDYGARGEQPGFRYVLLSSYEPRLQALAETRRALLALSLGGILVSALTVWFFVSRITRPLRELRDSAEAVGRGDFTRRLEHFPNDEYGDLAVAFNTMTASLQSSHAELRKAVDTLKATQGQLIQSEKLSAVGQFVAGVAHELNNPLTAVIGFSDLLVLTVKDPKTQSHLELIAKSAHRCHKIVQSLLGFARQHAPERKLVKMHELIDEVIEIMAYDLRTSNIAVTRDFPADLPVLVADPHQIQQVFINILGNARQAIQATHQTGSIIVRMRTNGPMVRLEFQDNGPGIRPENLARIFDPFFTTKPVGKGTGLGLSLSYGIIQEHGGKITAQSELGRGATFLIELPVASAEMVEAHAESMRKAATAHPFAPAGKAVLIVDDEEWILALGRELLSKLDYTVETAVSGEKALEALGRRRFDVVVSDWKMPGLNGMQLYEHLCATDEATARRVVFMTGDVINESFQEFLRRNNKSCLSKPFSIEEFKAAVAAIARSAQ